MQDEFAGVLTVKQRNAILKEIQKLESELQDMRQQEPEKLYKGSRYTTRTLLQNRRRQQFNERFKQIRDRVLQLRKRLGKDSTPIETKIKTGESLTGGKSRQTDKKVRSTTPAKKSTDKKPTPFLNKKRDRLERSLLSAPPLQKDTYTPIPREKPTPPMQNKDSDLVRSGARLKGFGYGDKSPQFLGNLDLNRAKSIRPDDDRGRLDQNILNVSENQGFGGTKPEDRDQNIVEKLVSSLLGRTIRFEDIPDDIDDPDSDVGYKSEGHYAYPAGRPDLRMGGMTSRSGATTKFKKPLGMKGGGNITRAQRQRIARIMQDYKQKKARKSNGKRTNR